MEFMTTAEIREKYLSYFEDKGCKRMPSSSLIPDDPSLLLTSAGMVQFKPYFLQQKQLEEPYIGTTTVQKCVRTNDIDIIGTTGRHLSFFEMLGNFSFGKYFKKEMCAWAYDFSVNVLGLPAERLYFTVFEDDDETIEIWKGLGVPEDHISRLGEDDNFWRAGPTGPCGPCSEIYFDQGPEFGCGSPDCAPGCDCDRFLEYWNCVFTQYDGQEDGTMLGNFSFGKYFKKEMCAWAYDFSVNVLGLPAERLYFTVFEDDDETIEIWKGLGVPEDHISRLGEDDNFWRAGPTGPCGPCSEIYFDQGPEFGCGSPDCAPGCDCDRFLEYWNCVFTQYDGQEDGTLLPLPKKNIDTGMGLERMAAIMQGVQSNYDTDVLRSLVGVGERLSGRAYGDDPDSDLALRFIADHSYVLRRLLRRAIMKAHLIGIEGPFLNEYVDEIVRLMGDVYPEVVENRELERKLILAEEDRFGALIGIEGPFLNEYVDEIVRLMGDVYPEVVENRELERKLILAEEDRFGATLRQGQTFLEEALANLEGDVLAGEEAFILHDTYGFPVEVTREIAEARGVTVDMEAFERSMAAQRERARAAGAKDAEAAWSTYGGVYADLLAELGPTRFVGYEATEAEGRVVALVRDGERVDALAAGEQGEAILDVTPFYAEMGGEVGDTGLIENGEGHAYVLDAKAPEKGLVVHAVRCEDGPLAVGDAVVARVDARRRASIERNHTATHLLHAALRQVLGEHVKQAGSYVGPDRLRFDFTHFEALTPEQVAEVERVANLRIMEAVPTTIYETSLDEARASGVTALFGEKYGEKVRVVEAGDFSRELCGGCHVRNTAEIGFLKVTSESSVGANLRRIEAVTSYGALAYVDKVESELKEAAATLRVPLFDVSERVAADQKTLRDLRSKGKRAKEMIGGDAVGELLAQVQEAPAGYPVIIARTEVRDGGQMRNLWDVVRSRMERPGALVVAGVNDGKPVLMAAGSDEAVAAGFNAGALIKAMGPAIQGGGGGKPTMAQAGGKNPDGIDDALQIARDMVL